MIITMPSAESNQKNSALPLTALTAPSHLVQIIFNGKFYRNDLEMAKSGKIPKANTVEEKL